jgi:hypothetical protein
LISAKAPLHAIWLSAALTSSSLLLAGSASRETPAKYDGGKPAQNVTIQDGGRDTSRPSYPQAIVRGKRWRWRSFAFITPSTSSVPNRLMDLLMTLDGG